LGWQSGRRPAPPARCWLVGPRARAASLEAARNATRDATPDAPPDATRRIGPRPEEFLTQTPMSFERMLFAVIQGLARGPARELGRPVTAAGTRARLPVRAAAGRGRRRSR